MNDFEIVRLKLVMADNNIEALKALDRIEKKKIEKTEERNHLVRFANYVGFSTCSKCGGLIFPGHICHECSHDPSYD